jgi:hypothetical protein
LSGREVDDDVMQIDTILEASEPGYPPEIDERRRRPNVNYYESGGTTEESDDREQREEQRLKKNAYSRIYRARKMEARLRMLSGNQPITTSTTRKTSQSRAMYGSAARQSDSMTLHTLTCPYCGFIGRRPAGFTNHLRACRRRHGDEPTPTASPDETLEDERTEEFHDQRRHENAINVRADSGSTEVREEEAMPSQACDLSHSLPSTPRVILLPYIDVD